LIEKYTKKFFTKNRKNYSAQIKKSSPYMLFLISEKEAYHGYLDE